MMNPPMWRSRLDLSLQNIFFDFEGAMNKLQYPLQFSQLSMSLFDTLVVKEPTTISKSVLDLFMLNNNFPTT